jgi:hypothetical protein
VYRRSPAIPTATLITAAIVTAAVITTALSACGGTGPPAPVGTGTVTVAAPPSTRGAVATPTAPRTPTPATWAMPDLAGHGLQEAQDTVQLLTDHGIAVTTSHDASGAGRMQVSDRNWKVCSQSIEPGAAITPGTVIDFGAVKLDEDC